MPEERRGRDRGRHRVHVARVRRQPGVARRHGAGRRQHARGLLRQLQSRRAGLWSHGVYGLARWATVQPADRVRSQYTETQPE